MREKVGSFVLKLLGVLLLVAAVLKGYELLTVPVANTDVWANRGFMILQVEFELALGIWLLSGVFKRAGWLAAVTCFGFFCCVTFYKALAGFGSCGCFGIVHVDPWVTLLAVDLPAVVLLCFVPTCIIYSNKTSYLHTSHQDFAWSQNIQGNFSE